MNREEDTINGLTRDQWMTWLDAQGLTREATTGLTTALNYAFHYLRGYGAGNPPPWPKETAFYHGEPLHGDDPRRG